MNLPSAFSLARRQYWPLAVLVLGLWSGPGRAQVVVDLIVTPLGGSFRYDLSVQNHALEDLAIVSVTDAPLADPLIDPSLVVPTGFLASYDDGLGFVDLLGDADVFAAGTTVSGFSFESLDPPGVYFTEFEALGVLGTSFTGSIRVVPVPEVSPTLAAFFVLGCALWPGLRRSHFPR